MPQEEVTDQQEESTDQVDEVKPDPIKNLQSETSRKIQNLQKQLQEMNSKNEQLYNMVISSNQEKQAAKSQKSSSELRDLVLDDPEQVARIIEERAVTRASEVVSQQVNRSQQIQAVVNEVQSRYPEFGKGDSEASNLAIEKASRLPNHLRGTPEGTKMALLEVVSELGLVAANKRTQSRNDDFAIGGQAPAQKRQSASPKVDERTLELAKLLSPGIEKDSKRLEALAKAGQRKNWKKYSSGE